MNRLVIIANEKSNFNTTTAFNAQINSYIGANKIMGRLGIFSVVDAERLHDVRYERDFMKSAFIGVEQTQEVLNRTFLEESFMEKVYSTANISNISPLRQRLHRYFNVEQKYLFQTIILFIYLRILQFFGIIIEKVWFDRRIVPSADTLPLCTDNWHIEHLSLPDVTEAAPGGSGGGSASVATGSGVVVAVLDGGIKTSNTFLTSRLELFGSQLGIDCVTPLRTSSSTTTSLPVNIEPTAVKHGTEVAGIISNTSVSCVAKDAKILNVKIADNIETAFLSNLARGINACAQLDNATPLAKVLNISWNTKNYFLNSLRFSGSDQIAYAADTKKCIIVFSAGNYRISVKNGYYIPKNAELYCVIVAGVDKNNQLWYNDPGFGSEILGTNYGPKVTIAAPANWLCTLYSGVPAGNPSGTGEVIRFNGTSAAAPHIAGVIALMLSIKPNLPLDAIKTTLAIGGATVTVPPIGFGAVTNSDYGGFKMVNAEAVLNAVRAMP
jgi:hypothetical protein